MTRRLQYGTPAGDAFLNIRKLARASGGDVQELLTLYALEGLLSRIVESPYRFDFVLKGGVLLAAFNLRRATKDIDLQATGLSNNIGDVLERIRAIAAIDLADGLVFDPGEAKAATIREGDDYSGVRVSLTCFLGKSRLSIGVDVNFGDPIWPGPSEISIPRLLGSGGGPLRFLGYPLHMVVAEKTITAIELGIANTRWRDFADILAIGRRHELGATELRSALETVANYRSSVLQPLFPLLNRMPEIAQQKWTGWRQRQALKDSLPELFSSVLEDVAILVDPILRNPPLTEARWIPGSRVWR